MPLTLITWATLKMRTSPLSPLSARGEGTLKARAGQVPPLQVLRLGRIRALDLFPRAIPCEGARQTFVEIDHRLVAKQFPGAADVGARMLDVAAARRLEIRRDRRSQQAVELFNQIEQGYARTSGKV